MNEAQKNRLRAKIAVSLYRVLGRQPTAEEVEQQLITSQVQWTVVAGVKSMRHEMKKRKQIPLF